MTGFLLDTNIPSETVRRQPDAMVILWLAAQNLDELYLSAITCGELRKGIGSLIPGRKKRELETCYSQDLLQRIAGWILPFTQRIAERWGTWGQNGCVPSSIFEAKAEGWSRVSM